MKFSAWPAPDTPWPALLDLCRHVADTGWDGIWAADHFMENGPNNLGPMQEAWTLLAGLAPVVPRVRLGTLVTGNTYRNPGVLAKQAAQVDVMSGGRAVLGIGAGWQENEHVAYDIPFYSVAERLGRLREAVQIIRSLLDNERTTFNGKYYTFSEAPLAPKPVQARLPILVGGGGEKVTLRITARYADEWNVWGTAEGFAQKSAVLDAHCREVGREPNSIHRTSQALVSIENGKDAGAGTRFEGLKVPSVSGSLEQMRDQIGRYKEAGLDEFILPDFNMPEDISARKEAFDQFMEDVATPFR